MSNTSSIAHIDNELALLTNPIATHDQSNGRAIILKQAQLLDRRAVLLLDDVEAGPLEPADVVDLATAGADAGAASRLAGVLMSDPAFRDTAALIVANASISQGLVALMSDQNSEILPYLQQASQTLDRFFADEDPRGEAVRHRLVSLEAQFRDTRLRQAAVGTADEDRAELHALVAEIARLIVRAGELVQQLKTQGSDHELRDDLVAAVAEAVVRRGKFEVASHDRPEVVEARERGREMRRAAWQSGEMLFAPDFQIEKGVRATDEQLAPFRDKHILFGLPHPERPSEFAYPAWQLPMHMHTEFQQILATFGQSDPWSIWHFFHRRHSMLQDRTPLEVLGLTRPGEEFDRNELLKALSEHELKAAISKVIEAAHDYLQGPD